jgi:hypothetical protein
MRGLDTSHRMVGLVAGSLCIKYKHYKGYILHTIFSSMYDTVPAPRLDASILETYNFLVYVYELMIYLRTL